MLSNRKELYVVDVIKPLCIIGSMEDAVIEEDCICYKKVFDKDNVVYIDVVSDSTYYFTDKIGYTRVINDSVRPLSLYYNFLGLPKNNEMKDSNKVRSKVRYLKRKNKI